MEKLFKNTFDKVTMNEQSKNEMRNMLEGADVKNKWSGFKHVACAAIILGLLLCIPTVRSLAAEGISYIIQVFHTANGDEVTYKETDNELEFTISYSHSEYTSVKNGRLYFVFGDEYIDITDKCSENDYFRYEVIGEDGIKNVLFVGGTVENNGWVNLVFDADGNYIFNEMSIESYSPWAKKAMHDEGVPTGDPYYDEEILN